MAMYTLHRDTSTRSYHTQSNRTVITATIQSAYWMLFNVLLDLQVVANS